MAAPVTVPAGQRTATFAISTILVASQVTATITASRATPVAGSAQATLTVNPATMQLSGLAPGFAVPGTQDLLVYGTGLPANVSMKILGPVYALGVVNPPVLCNASSNGNCPSVTAPAVRSPAGTSAYFGIPSGLSSGLYLVRSTSPTDGDSLNGVWLAVADPEPSYPVQNEVDHQSQRRIVSGQTVLGEFGTLAPPVGDFTDFNGYYFLGTAGSRITVSLERVDTTRTWEHPDSIDPDLRIVAPDGMIYGNLYKYDNREGVDLNATITNAVVPQTGIYRIVAGTSHGSGAYRLRFNVDSVAPVNVGERIIPMGGMGATLPVGQPYDVFAAVLDSRGHPVSSANVNWTAMAGAPVFLNGTSSATSFDGVAGISLRLDTPGIVRVKADATDPLLNLGAMQGEEFLKQALPRFDAVGSGPRFEGMGKNGEPRFSNAPVKTLPVELFERSRELSTPPSTKTSPAKPGTAKGKAPAPAKPTAEPAGEKGLGVKLSRASFPLPAAAMLQNNCSNSAGAIDLGAVAGTPDGPYTFTLTDVTGGGSKVIDGAAGFEDLYIGKTRTLRLDIKDATGATPNYPIVVRIGTSGTRAGTVALDANAPGLHEHVLPLARIPGPAQRPHHVHARHPGLPGRVREQPGAARNREARVGDDGAPRCRRLRAHRDHSGAAHGRSLPG